MPSRTGWLCKAGCRRGQAPAAGQRSLVWNGLCPCPGHLPQSFSAGPAKSSLAKPTAKSEQRDTVPPLGSWGRGRRRGCPCREGRGCATLIDLSATLQGRQYHSSPAFGTQFALPVVVISLFSAALYWLGLQSRLQFNQSEGRGAADCASFTPPTHRLSRRRGKQQQATKEVGRPFFFFFSSFSVISHLSLKRSDLLVVAIS